MFLIRMTGCDDHVVPGYFCVRSLVYRTRGKILLCDITKSCDSHDEFPLCIVNIVVALVDMYGERWETWLLEICNHDLRVSLLAFVEQSIFQVW